MQGRTLGLHRIRAGLASGLRTQQLKLSGSNPAVEQIVILNMLVMCFHIVGCTCAELLEFPIR